MLELAVRLIVSLAVVLGALILLARMANKRFTRRSGLIEVVHRQPLGRGSAAVVVTVGERVLLLGTTEQHVSLLTELDPDALDLVRLEAFAAADPMHQSESERSSLRSAARTRADGALTGSVLSPTTWRQAFELLSRRRS